VLVYIDKLVYGKQLFWFFLLATVMVMDMGIQLNIESEGIFIL